MSSEPDLASLMTDFHEAAHAATDPVRKELYAMLLRLAKAANTELAQIESQLDQRIAKIEQTVSVNSDEDYKD
jgi:hypothetical protein